MISAPTAELMERSDLVVRGFVTQITVREGERAGEIETVITTQVQERIKGESPAQVFLTIPGGEINGRFMFMTDQPDFTLGQETVLFLDTSRPGIVGQIQGKVTLADGLALEMMLDADDYLDSLRNLAVGLAPVIDLDVHFSGKSSIRGYLENRISPLFGYSGMHWNKSTVGLYINENYNNADGEGDAVKTAMATWNDVKADFKFDYKGEHSTNIYTYNGVNEAMWINQSYDYAIAFVMIWGEGDMIVECDLNFLKSYNWSTQGNPDNDEMDVQNIATHELGHFLCLDDLYDYSDSEKTMFGYAMEGETNKRSLENDDKAGIIEIYGPGEGNDDYEEPVDEGMPREDCVDIMDVIYDRCDEALVKGNGEVLDYSSAIYECDYGASTGIWECLRSCYLAGDDCADVIGCMEQDCQVNFDSPGGDDDDDSGGSGSACGLA